MKIIAFYLPQFHTIPENDEWWGKGFTEWTNVRKAEPVIQGQIQPKVPLNNNYYCLLDDETKLWQVKLAREAGIYGFCYYHYWFNGKLLLEKPAEQMLNNPKVDLPFCFSWANEPWSRSWKGDSKNVIMPQEYGSEDDWKKHFEYLLPFFNDERYIKDNGKPMFIIYKPDIIPSCYRMMACWNEMAINNGFPGIFFGFQFPSGYMNIQNEKEFDFAIEFEPLYSQMAKQDFIDMSDVKGKIKLLIKHPVLFLDITKKKVLNTKFNKPIIYKYEKVCQGMISRKPRFKNSVPGIFTSWDKTPRNGSRATIYTGSSPKIFGKYLKAQIKRAKSVFNTEYLFVTAWNEWGEGAFLEPDVENGEAYLETVKEVLNN